MIFVPQKGVPQTHSGVQGKIGLLSPLQILLNGTTLQLDLSTALGRFFGHYGQVEPKGWGALANQKRSSIYVDAQGRTRQCILLGNATLAPVEAALIGVSNADVQQSWEATPVVNAAPAPANALYPTVADYVPLVYADAAGNLVYITLVAPQAGIFQADAETVNPAAIAAVTTAVVGLVLTSAGLPAAAFVGGTRRRSLKEYQ